MKNILISLGFSAKEVEIYLTVLRLGPSPVRQIAEAAGINRGTTYDILKELMSQGLVAFYNQEKRQHFAAEDPEALHKIYKSRIDSLARQEEKVSELIPELRLLHHHRENKTVVRYYQGRPGVEHVLSDILREVSQLENKEYLAYSSASLKSIVFEAMPDFTERRIELGIHVKVIAMGEGGQLMGMDERKWLSDSKAAPTYTFIYADRVATIAVDEATRPIAVVIQDQGITETHSLVFNGLWDRL